MTYYTVDISYETADSLVTDMLRQTIESDCFEEGDQMLTWMVEVHNYFCPPDKHIELANEVDE
jgi:hypothetical protein